MTTTETNAHIIICGPSEGHYGRPWKILGPHGVKGWRDSEGRTIRPPKISYCSHPKHRAWAKDARRTRFATVDGYVQRWVMSKRELHAAVRAWDIFSLEMPPRLVCPSCAKRMRVREAGL